MFTLSQVKVLLARALGKTRLRRLAPAVYISSLNGASPKQQAWIHYRLAHAYAQSGDNHASLTHLQNAVALEPTISYWQYKLGATQIKLGLAEEALSTYEAMLTVNPLQHSALYGKARALGRLNDVAGAINTLQLALEQSPKTKRYHTLMVKLVRRTGQEPMIRRALEDAIDNVAAPGDWLSSLVSIYESTEEHELILGLLNRPEFADTCNAESAFWRGRALDKIGQQSEAEEVLRFAAGLLPEDTSVLGPGYFYQTDRQYADAIRWYRRSAEYSDNIPELHYQLGRCLEAEYTWEEAEAEFELACTSENPQPHWYGHWGIAREQLGKYTEASDVYRKANILDGQPNNSWAYRLVYVLVQLERYSESVEEILKTCIEAPDQLRGLLFPKNEIISDTDSAFRIFEDYAKRGLRLLDNGEYKEAAGEFEEAILRNSAHWSSLYRCWSIALAKSGQERQSATAFLKSRMVQSSFLHDSRGLLKARESRQRIHYAEFHQDYLIDHNAILYESGAGITVACNPLAICRSLLLDERYSNFRHFWAVNKGESVPHYLLDDPRVYIIRRNSDLYFKILASAKYLINNNTFPPVFSRRPEQKYLNTWHGVPLKTLGVDIQNGQMDHRNAARNLLHTTHLLVPNSHTKKILLERYDIQGLFTGAAAELGYPRIDNVINPNIEITEKIRRRLGLSSQDTVLLYAPTWRGDLKGAVLDEAKIRSDLEKLSGTGCKVLFRGHTMVEKILSGSSLGDVLVPADIDTNDLLALTDILVTDYSSIFFDFIPTGRPIFYYAYDLDEYKDDRGLYFDLKDMPGTVCTSIESLTESIESLNSTDLSDRIDYTQALQRFCPSEDGNASARAIDFFFNDDQKYVSKIESDSKINALFYQGSFIPNGITSSFRNLVANLPLDRVRTTVILQPNSVYGRPERLENLRAIENKVQLIGVVGGHLATLEERLVVAEFNENFELNNTIKEKILDSAYSREFRRIFGFANFDAAVSFEGFQRHFTSLIAATPNPKLGHSIMLHSAMKRERDTRFRQLKAIFSLYPKFEHLVSVSKSVSELNQKDITSEINVSLDRFDYAENLLDIENILENAIAPISDEVANWILESDYSFANVARLSPEKDHQKLIRALAYARDLSGLDLRLLLVGDGPNKSKLESLCVNLGLENAVLFTGRLSNPYPVVKAVDCFVFSSNYEGQGLAVLESLVLGTPVISTDVVGPRSILENGFGMLVDNSVDGLAKGLVEQVLNQPEYRAFDAKSYNREALLKFNKIVLGI